mmetsp:Transcript_721/g.1940  ORF Transcript_721/g.1940 Transcript_721/m.1940 type:complete len:311 (+) Transcript_721:352-1284(+)
MPLTDPYFFSRPAHTFRSNWRSWTHRARTFCIVRRSPLGQMIATRGWCPYHKSLVLHKCIAWPMLELRRAETRAVTAAMASATMVGLARPLLIARTPPIAPTVGQDPRANGASKRARLSSCLSRLCHGKRQALRVTFRRPRLHLGPASFSRAAAAATVAAHPWLAEIGGAACRSRGVPRTHRTRRRPMLGCTMSSLAGATASARERTSMSRPARCTAGMRQYLWSALRDTGAILVLEMSGPAKIVPTTAPNASSAPVSGPPMCNTPSIATSWESHCTFLKKGPAVGRCACASTMRPSSSHEVPCHPQAPT